MEHKKLHKYRGDFQQLREKRRIEEKGLRKERRDRLLDAKRIRLDEADTEEDEETDISDQVNTALTNLQKDPGARLDNLKILRRAFARGTRFIDEFLKHDSSLPFLVGALTGVDCELQLEAAWCFTNIAAGTHDHALKAGKAAAPYLITYLSSSNPKLQNECAWALGNIAGDSAECRDLLRAQGVVLPLVQLLQSPVPQVIQSSAFALSNLARGDGANTKELVDAGVCPLILQLIQEDISDLQTLSEAAWVLTYLTASGEHEDIIFPSLQRVCPVLVSLSAENTNNSQVVTPLLRCLGNLCSGPEECSIQTCQCPGMVTAVEKYLHSDHRHIRKEILWVLSNLTSNHLSV